jgi:hypothetical protein
MIAHIENKPDKNEMKRKEVILNECKFYVLRREI